jgi:cysteine desulfurase
MWVNNVLGTVQPVEAIAAAVAAERVRRGAGGLPIAFLCDAVQALPALETRGAVADLLTCSAHKIAGPKGVGALRIAAGAPFAAFGGGGGQEEGRRHGTENVAGIVGFGEAARLLADGRPARAARLAELRRAFLSALAETAPRATVVGAEGVPGIVFLRVPGVPGDELALKLDAAGFAVSAGSACDSGSRKAPRVLAAVLDEQAARLGGVRVSFGPATPEDDLRRCAAAIGRSIKTPR